MAKLKESWQHLLRDRASRTLTYNDEQFHILEKIKMQETIRVLADLLSKECQPTASGLTESLADWYKMAQTTFLQAEILRRDVSALEEDMGAFAVASGSLTRDRSEAAFEEALESLKEFHSAAAARKSSSSSSGQAVNGSALDSSSKGRGASSTSNATGATAVAAATAAAAASCNNNNSSEPRAQIRRALRSILATQDEVNSIFPLPSLKHF